MDRVEQRGLFQTTEWALAHFRADHRFCIEDIRNIHRHWLGHMYPWAGEYRQVNVSKSGFMFAAAAQVPRLMEAFNAENLAPVPPHASRGEKLFALAQTHVELLLIHPFREGNGRLARLLATLMALQTGFRTPTFEALLSERREEYFAAVRAGLDRNYEPMRRLFASVVGDAGS